MYRPRIWCLLLLFAAPTALAQYQTPTINGVVSVGEYANSNSHWLMTWDATYLYVAHDLYIDSTDTLAVYLDIDPLSTPGGGTAANGNLTGVSTNFTPSLPFRADVRVFADGSSAEIRSRDGSGSWSADNTNASDITAAVNGTTIELRIRWGALPGLSGVPASFHWLGYLTDDIPQVYRPMPPANPVGGDSAPKDRYFFSVASTADGASTNPFSVRQSTWRVTSNADAGTDTLRDAITNANADVDSSRRFITFGLGDTTITLTSNAPTITGTTTIDGTSQTGGTTPAVTIAGASSAIDGMLLQGTSSVVRGLVLQGFGNGLVLLNASNSTVAGNYIGTNAAGTAAAGNQTGVVLIDSDDCVIGGTAAADRNVISGNATSGLVVSGSDDVVIQGNYVGTNAAGSAAIANLSGIGIADSSSNCTIGGTSSAERNVVSGNTLIGIEVSNVSNLLIEGNYVGTDANGTSAVPNGLGMELGSASGTVVGAAGAPNVISGNSSHGVRDRGNVSYFNNQIGTTKNFSPLGNGGFGIASGSPGANKVVGSLALPNTIAYNAGGISANNTGGLLIRGNQIYGNTSSSITVTNVIQPAPTVSSAVVSDGTLTVVFSLTTNSAASMQVDFYEADSTNAIAQPVLHKAASPCYSGSSLTNQSWVVGSGYKVNYKSVLIATSYSDGACTTAGDGSSANTAIVRTTAPHTFTGPGDFSDPTKWSGGALPPAGEDFAVVGACTFDDGAPVRAYGNMSIGDGGTTATTLSWEAGNGVVLDVKDVIDGTTGDMVDMTNGGTLRSRGTFALDSSRFTRGAGTVEFAGTGQILNSTPDFNNISVTGSATKAGGNFNVHGNLDVQGGASFTCPTGVIARFWNGASMSGSGTIAFWRVEVQSGQTVTSSASFTASLLFTVGGTFTPESSAVISGTGALNGNGTVKVTSTATNSLSSQYTLTRTLTNLTVEYAGSASQSIDGTTYKNLTINNAAGAVVNTDATVTGTLTFTAGVVTTMPGQFINVTNSATNAVSATSGWARGTAIQWAFATGTNTYTFPVGTAAVATPATLTVNGATVAGTVSLSASTATPPLESSSGIDPARNANVSWTLTFTSGTISSYDIALSDPAGALDAAATPETFVLRRFNGTNATWAAISSVATASSISASSLTQPANVGFEFLTGNQLIDHYVVTASSPQSTSTPFTTTVTAQDLFNITANDSSTVVTMSSSTGNAQFDSNGNGTFGDNTKTLTDGAFTISTKDDTIESVTITATDANSKTGSSSAIAVNLGAPAISATATSPSQVSVTWTAVGGAVSYEVFRSSLGSGYSLVGSTAGTAISDPGLTANVSYLYKVRSVATGGGLSSFSAIDPATTILFTDATLTSTSSTIKAVHITELRTAVNAMRSAAGLAAATFTDPSLAAGDTIKAVHVTELRTALDTARSTIGLSALVYTDSSIVAGTTTAKTAHIAEPRAGVQ